MTVLRTHAHESATQERFIIFDRVERSHRCVNLTVISEDAHRHRSAEGARDFLVGCTLLLEYAITLTLIDRPREDLLHLLGGETARERCSLLASQFATERRLQELDDMLTYCFLGILLHSRVDSGIYLQSVGIYIIWCTVFLRVLVAPTV